MRYQLPLYSFAIEYKPPTIAASLQWLPPDTRTILLSAGEIDWHEGIGGPLLEGNLSNELIFNPYILQKDNGEPRWSPRNEATRTHSLRTLPRRKIFLPRYGGFEDRLPTSRVPFLQKQSQNVLYVLSWCSSMRWLFRSACFWCWNWKWQTGTDSSHSKFSPRAHLWAAFFSVIYLVIHLKRHVIRIHYSVMSQLPIEKLFVGQCCRWVIGGQRCDWIKSIQYTRNPIR